MIDRLRFNVPLIIVGGVVVGWVGFMAYCIVRAMT